MTPQEAEKWCRESDGRELAVKLDLLMTQPRSIPDRNMRAAIRAEAVRRLGRTKGVRKSDRGS